MFGHIIWRHTIPMRLSLKRSTWISAPVLSLVLDISAYAAGVEGSHEKSIEGMNVDGLLLITYILLALGPLLSDSH